MKSVKVILMAKASSKKSQITYIGKTTWRNQHKHFGIYQKDRFFHKYVLGQTGTGKTTLLKTLIQQDIQNGSGLCLIDPHGDLVDEVAKNIPKDRRKDVVYFNVADTSMKYRFNPLGFKGNEDQQMLVVSDLLDILKKLWGRSWGIRLEHILRFIIITLLHQKNASLNHIIDIIHDKEFRENCLYQIESKYIKQFWEHEFPKYSIKDLLPILNKIGTFVAHPAISRACITNSIEVDIQDVIDNRKILLINVSKGQLGEDVSHLIGSVFVSAISSAAFKRVNIDEQERKDFMLYLDEFQNFTNLTLVTMLSELRKFRVGLVFAHQYLHQLHDAIRFAILGNVGTLIAFRVGAEDAPFLVKAMEERLEEEDFVHLPNYHICIKLMIKGKPSKPFSAMTFNKKERLELLNQA